MSSGKYFCSSLDIYNFAHTHICFCIEGRIAAHLQRYQMRAAEQKVRQQRCLPVTPASDAECTHAETIISGNPHLSTCVHICYMAADSCAHPLLCSSLLFITCQRSHKRVGRYTPSGKATPTQNDGHIGCNALAHSTPT